MLHQSIQEREPQALRSQLLGSHGADSHNEAEAQEHPALGPGGGTEADLSHVFGGMFDPVPEGKVPVPEKKPTPGLFPGVTDLTGKYGGLASGKRSRTSGVVLHRTESSTAKSTLDGYDERIKSGSHIGAQYLIDEKGGTSLVTPLDSMVSHSKGFSDSAVGVEVVGPAKSIDRSGKKGSVRDQIKAMNLSPEFKARLLSYDDKKLGNVAKWNNNQIYEDVSGAQKRSVWNLSNQLADQYGLDLGSTSNAGKDESGTNNYSLNTLPDFSAHEHINPKAMGEGEAMIEFIRARRQYPALVAQAEKQLADLTAQGGDPAKIKQLTELVAKERATLAALNVDGTQAELDAVKSEQTANKPGEATLREQSRTSFYDNFYSRIGALKDLNKPAPRPNS